MSVIGALSGRHALASRRPIWLQVPFVAVIGAMTFNFALCFVNTNVVGGGVSAVIGCEVVIISSVLLYAYPILDYRQFLVVASALLYLLALSALRALMGEGFGVKSIRDVLIPVAFFLLGAGSGDMKTADKIVQAAVLIVVAVGLFEYFFTDTFTRFFNIAGFYVERGAMDTSQAQQSSNLFVSGMRPEGFNGGRNLLPFLGNHRVSSIFLEPVSAGNFGIIVFMWALVRSLMERRIFWGLFASGLLIIVLSDSRFGAFFCGICLLLALLPASIRIVLVAVLPVCGLLAVVVLPDAMSEQYRISAGLMGRVDLAGRILDRFDALNWFGLTPPEFVTSDSGYAYALAGLGIIGLIIFWALLMSTRGSSSRFYLFRDLAGAYFAVLLCISNSPFTIKTGALLWFLVGVLSRASDAGSRLGSRRSGSRHANRAPVRGVACDVKPTA